LLYWARVASTVKWLSAGWMPGIRSAAGAEILLAGTVSRSALEPIQWVPESLYLLVRRRDREIDHSAPPGVEVKNTWSITSTPLCASMKHGDFSPDTYYMNIHYFEDLHDMLYYPYILLSFSVIKGNGVSPSIRHCDENRPNGVNV
jgi:hypothetical protein